MDENRRGQSYGSAGKSLGSDEAISKFGKDAVVAGSRGERQLAYALSKSPITRGYTVWQSMRIPAAPGQKRYSGDVDFILASGNRVILVDCKMWASKNVYWSFMGTVMKNFGTMQRKNEPYKMNKNMELALSRYRESLPGCNVQAAVIFVPTSNGQLPTSVGLLIWPGKIRSFLTQDGINRIGRVLGKVEQPSDKVQALMGRMLR